MKCAVTGLPCHPLPDGVSVSLKPARVSGKDTATLTVTTGAATPVRTLSLTITGTAAGITRNTTVALTVNTPGGGQRGRFRR